MFCCEDSVRNPPTLIPLESRDSQLSPSVIRIGCQTGQFLSYNTRKVGVSPEANGCRNFGYGPIKRYRATLTQESAPSIVFNQITIRIGDVFTSFSSGRVPRPDPSGVASHANPRIALVFGGHARLRPRHPRRISERNSPSLSSRPPRHWKSCSASTPMYARILPSIDATLLTSSGSAAAAAGPASPFKSLGPAPVPPAQGATGV